MPKRSDIEENRKAREAAENAAITIEVKGETYVIKMAGVTALDELDYKQATGEDLTPIIMGATTITLYAVAGLIWLERRKSERNLAFREVAQGLRMLDLSSVEYEDGTEDVTPPEDS